MKVDGKALERAIARVAERRFAAELREAIVYGPQCLSEVLAAYEEEVTKRNRRAARVLGVIGGVAFAAMVLAGALGYLHGLGKL